MWAYFRRPSVLPTTTRSDVKWRETTKNCFLNHPLCTNIFVVVVEFLCFDFAPSYTQKVQNGWSNNQPTQNGWSNNQRTVVAGQQPTVHTPVKRTNKTNKPSQIEIRNAALEVVLGMEPSTTKKPKFNKEYDAFLCRAYVNVTQDSTRGIGQNREDFWNKVLVKFQSLCEDPSVLTWEVVTISNRFQRVISKSCSVFVNYLRMSKQLETNFRQRLLKRRQR